MGLPFAGAVGNGGSESGRSSLLDQLNEAAQHQYQYERHMGAVKAALDHLSRAHGAAVKAGASSCCDKPAPQPADLTAITEQLNKLNQKVSDLERLVHTHDNALLVILPKVGIQPKKPD
jgi:hypothetical protein